MGAARVCRRLMASIPSRRQHSADPLLCSNSSSPRHVLWASSVARSPITSMIQFSQPMTSVMSTQPEFSQVLYGIRGRSPVEADASSSNQSTCATRNDNARRRPCRRLVAPLLLPLAAVLHKVAEAKVYGAILQATDTKAARCACHSFDSPWHTWDCCQLLVSQNRESRIYFEADERASARQQFYELIRIVRQIALPGDAKGLSQATQSTGVVQ